jgi:polyhydroxybutyrate depolymerase
MSHRVQIAIVTAVALVLTVTACSRRSDPSAGGRDPTTASSSESPSASSSVVPAVKPTATMQDGTIRTPDSRDRTYHLYVPNSLTPGQSVPLLVAMHGGVGWGLQYAKNSNFDGLAEANRFIVVFPDGIGIGPDNDSTRTWNGGDCCGPAAKQNVDDVAFISQLIDTIEQSQPVDQTRVFAAGHSNGGIMAYRLACELSDKIVAVGVQSSSLELDSCHPTHPVSLIHIHGTADKNLPIDGGVGVDGISGVDFKPPLDGIHTLVSVDACPADSTTTVDADNADVTTETWQPCRDGTAVEFVKVAGATHAWMGAPAQSTRLAGEPYLKLDSSAAIWSFLSAHPRTSA